MDDSKDILHDNALPYWIIDGYYFQPNYEDIDRSILMKKDGEGLVGITEEEYDKMLNYIKSKLFKNNSSVII